MVRCLRLTALDDGQPQETRMSVASLYLAGAKILAWRRDSPLLNHSSRYIVHSLEGIKVARQADSPTSRTCRAPTLRSLHFKLSHAQTLNANDVVTVAG